METEDVADLVKALSPLVRPNRTLVVGIDGASGSGKSSLALDLSTRLAGKVFHIDDYVERKRGEYLKRIDYESAGNDIGQFMSENIQLVVIEGVCLLNILETLRVEPHKVIYVKRVARDGYWYDYRLSDPEFSLEESLHYVDRSENVPGIGNLDREITTYHHQYSPLEKADFIFRRVQQ